MLRRKMLFTLLALLPLLLVLALITARWTTALRRYRAACLAVSGDYTVPVDSDLIQPTLLIHYTGGDVTVLSDGETVFHDDTDAPMGGSLTGARTLLVTLPEDIAGKHLRLTIRIDDKEVNTLLEMPRLGSYNNVFHLFIYQSLPALTIGTFLLLFGVIFLLLTVGFSVSVRGVADHVLGAVICIVFGIWLFCSSGILSLFIRAPFDTFLEIGTSLLILPLLLFMLYALRDRHSYLETGIWMFAGCMVIYLIFAASESMYNNRMPDLATLLPIIGCLCFVMTQILNYYLNISASYARQEQYGSLSAQAYMDPLTGLPNRKSADNVFRSLNSGGGSYCIVSLDLDNLKIINDTFGHNAGDRMLKTAADVLNECVADKGFHARMGGDEFVIVLRRTSEDAVKALLARIGERLRERGRSAYGIEYSISIGYAFKEERKRGVALDVFKLADDRMYSQKAEKKAQAASAG